MLYTPKKTVDSLKQNHNHGLIQVKANQNKLLTNLRHLTKFNSAMDKSTIQDACFKRNRLETRTVELFKQEINPYQLGYVADDDWRKNIRMVIRLKRKTVHQLPAPKGKTKPTKTTRETAYFICTTAIYSAERLNRLIRLHWSIENQNHRVRDVTLEEDASRIRKKPGNMARIKSLVLNILRFQETLNIAAKIQENAWNSNFFQEYSWLGSKG